MSDSSGRLDPGGPLRLAGWSDGRSDGRSDSRSDSRSDGRSDGPSDGWSEFELDGGSAVESDRHKDVRSEPLRSSQRSLVDRRLDELFTDPPDEVDPFASSDSRSVPDSSRGSGRSGRKSLLAGGARMARWRIDPERRGAVAVMVAVIVAVIAVGWQALVGRPHAEAVSNSSTSSATWSAGSARTGSSGSAPSTTRFASSGAAPTAATTVVVDVVGRVHRPGLVTLPPGARVADAVRAAGGAWAGTNLSSINLARICVDGEQIAIGVPGAVVAAPGATATAGASAPGALVDLNTATPDQLDALPGVGPVMAQRIIQYRTDHGPFQSVDQLRQVSGIGDAKYADLSPLVTV